jgi:hypothetical protein
MVETGRDMKSLLSFFCLWLVGFPVFAMGANQENSLLLAAVILAILAMIFSLKYLRIYLLSLVERFFSLDEDTDM